MRSLTVAWVGLVLAGPALAQSPSARLLDAARRHISAGQEDSAEAALREALDSAAYTMDSANALVWQGILEHLRGNDSLARLAFRSAIRLRSGATVRGLERISPDLAQLFEEEVRAASVYPVSTLDEPLARRSGPTVVYPPDVRRRRVAGRVAVRFVVDTLGNVEAQSVEVLETPDSGLIEALKRMIVATSFAPGRVKGHPVRTYGAMSFNVTPPPPPNATQLATAARQQVAARRPDSALALLEEVLDPATSSTAGERAYALLVQGLAWNAAGRDSLATRAFDAGLAGYADLTARGVDLAPFLRRLADSIRIARRRGTAAAPAPSPFGNPSTVDPVDQPPALVSHPSIRYAPEMQALGIGGTVIVEAALDTTGRVLPATVKIVQSPNPVFDAEAKRVVLAAVYRPARRAGRAIRVVISQPITFAAY